MTIPHGVNYITFYQQAKQKGIKLESRYKHVVIWYCKATKRLSFMAKPYKDGKMVCLGLYPFTEQGEKEANNSVQRYLSREEAA